MLKRIRKKLPHKFKQSKVWDKPSQESQQRLAFDQQLVWQQNKQKKVPSWRQFRYISSFFSARERFAIVAAIFGVFIAIGLGVFFVYGRYVDLQPTFGGQYSEALIGYPLYINPVLASTNDVDLDLVKLIFSGLLRYDNDLNLQPDLAESWKISEDGKVYTIVLRNDAVWHDNTEETPHPVTIEDVLFTYRTIQDPAVNSPLQLSFQDILIEKVDERTLTFTLPQAFTPFSSLLTTGIIPEHIWFNLPANNIRLAESNIFAPIGSGPWSFKKWERDKLGNIHTYTVEPFANYYGDKPYIQELTFKFYPDFSTAIAALNNNKVEGISFVPRQLIDTITNAQNHQTNHLQLPQYDAIFFNQEKNSVLQTNAVRQALAYSIDRDRLVTDVLDGLGRVTDGPLLPGMIGFDPELEGFPYNPIEAQRILEEAGWESISSEEYIQFETERIQKERDAAAEEGEETAEDEETEQEEEIEAIADEEPINVEAGNQAVFRKKDDKFLEIKLTTVNQPENIRAAEIVQNAWQTIGFIVELDIQPISTLTAEILPRRDYEALLYGQILNVFPDLYPFWHSSQIEHPGLNLANFADKDMDEYLETARGATDDAIQADNNKAAQGLLLEELPAIFLYSPKYTYLLPGKVKGFAIDSISIPADRWNNINEWYIKTKRKFSL